MCKSTESCHSSRIICHCKVVLAAGFAPALATFSTSCLFCWTTRAVCKWSLHPVMLRQDRFTKAVRRLLHGGFSLWPAHASQSPVLPRTQRAYETRLSAGSTAILADGHYCVRSPSKLACRAVTVVAGSVARLCFHFGAAAFAIAKAKGEGWSPHPELHRADSLTERMHR